MRTLLLVCLFVCSAIASASEVPPMRWRVFCDSDTQTSFRFPYDYSIPNQYLGALMREGRQVRVSTMVDGKVLNPDEIQARLRAAWRNPENADVMHVGGLVADLQGVDANDAAALVAHLSSGKLTAAESISYYAADGDSERPHADPDHAPEGVQAWSASGPEHSGRLLRWGDRYALLMATGAADAHDNAAIFDSFEIMVGRRSVQTWRAIMSAKAQVLAPDGSLVKARRGAAEDPTSWDDCWEVETEHYHVTCNVSPGRTLYYARLMEVLYELYSTVYDPDTIPPFKMEVHIFDGRERFFQMAAQRGFALPSPTVLGFFAPGQLCVYAFDNLQIGSMTTENVLAHEASHQFLHVTCNGSDHVPTWINEGLAVYFESAEFKNGKPSWAAPRQRLDRLRGFYGREQHTLIPLEDYIDHRGHIGADQYAEVYAMTHFWLFGSKGGKKRFKEYWQALKLGEDGGKAFERIFLEDMIARHGSKAQAMAVWQDALLRYVDKGYPAKNAK